MIELPISIERDKIKFFVSSSVKNKHNVIQDK